jgi:hypothetical protein
MQAKSDELHREIGKHVSEANNSLQYSEDFEQMTEKSHPEVVDHQAIIDEYIAVKK